MRYLRGQGFILLCLLLTLTFAACGSTTQQATDLTPTPNVADTSNGVVLPPNAAPPEHQVLVLNHSGVTIKTLDFFESVYSGYNTWPIIGNLFSDSLVRTNKNYQLVPGAATKWEIDNSGLVWTFHLDPNLIWSDDTPVTADDYVATFQYAADPKHKWDFSWYFNGVIKGWDEVSSGAKPLDTLGFRAVDAHTIQVETVAPAPYLPAMLVYGTTFQKKALAAHGGLYNTNPATAVSSGPFIVTAWQQDKYIVLTANPKYKGSNRPFLQKIILKQTEKPDQFDAYQRNEVDFVASDYLTAEHLQKIANDPELAKELHVNYGDFRTYYLSFDHESEPFNNPKVRQAFSHAIDRDALIKKLRANSAIPAYSFMMPGFPASNSNAYKPIQNFDPAKAKALLAEAGFPDGKGLPKLSLWIRDIPEYEGLALFTQQSLKEVLGIDVEVAKKSRADFIKGTTGSPLEAKLMIHDYGMDYLDPANMMGVWLGTGRHNWKNSEFDELVKKASSFTGDQQQRTKMFQDAERMLVEDVGGVFITHKISTDLYKPYLVGSELEPDDFGVSGFHYPGYNSFSTQPSSIYISKEVLKYRKGPPVEPGK